MSGCGPDGEDPNSTPTPTPIVIPGRACPPDTVVSYENFGSPFLSTWCTSCHASGLVVGERSLAPIGVNFDSYESVRLNAVRIYYRGADVQVTPTWMPPAGGPTDEDRFLLGDWLACDAPREDF